MDEPGARMRTAAGAALVMLTLAVSACGTSSPSPRAQSATGVAAGKSAAAILALALHNATKAGTMSYNVATQTSGAIQTVIGAASTQGGEVIVTSSSGMVRILVTGSTGYIESNSAADLASALGMPSALAAANTNKWISLTSTDSQFSALATATSFSSTLAEFSPGGSNLRLTEKTVAKRGVDVIDGTGTAPGTVRSYDVQLAVTKKTPVLPVGGATTLQGNGKTLTQTAVFSQWGKPLPLKAPVGATPLGSITAG